MKKTFLARRNALFSSTDTSWGAYALMGAVLLFVVRLLAPNFFLQIVTPIFRSANNLTTESHLFFSSFGDSAALTLQNEKLRDENTTLTVENETLSQKLADQEALLDVSAGKNTQGVLAGVVARPPESPYDTLVLAQGSSAGITVGQGVFSEGSVPIGIISAVTTDFSRATLFSSPNILLHGWVGHTNVPLTIVGLGGGTMGASAARSAGIVMGDSVWSPGPGTLPVGKVIRIDSDPSSPAVTLQIQPAVNLFSVTWVLVRDTGAALRGALSQATSTPL